jgi:hypothetical protein
MENFEVQILQPKATDILYDLEAKKLIRLTKREMPKKNAKKPDKSLIAQIETGLTDVSLIRSGKIKPKTLSEILHGK